MGRIRTVKPELFRHDGLFEAERKYQLPLRLAFIGLLTRGDREGRFRWQPQQIKLDIMPFDSVNMAEILDALAASGFIVKYMVDDKCYGCIPSWKKHQYITYGEEASTLPRRPL